MTLLIAGLVLWTTTHLLRSLLPELRDTLQQTFGRLTKSIIALVILVSLLMMIHGFNNAAFISLWTVPPWAFYVNNLLMVLALYIYLTTATVPGTAFLFGSLKHPQLIGFQIWSVSHMLVNGDLAAMVFFGGLFVWAVVQWLLSSNAPSVADRALVDGTLVDRSSASITSAWGHLGAVVVVYAVICAVHVLFGRWPFAPA